MRKVDILTDGERDIFVNPKTGEVYESKGVGYLQTEEERQKRREFYQKLKERQEQAQIINEKYKEYGNFVWNVYGLNQLNFENLHASDVTRLMFLSTYLNYDGYLMFNNRNPLDKKNMLTLLNISQSEFKRFYKSMFDNKILYFQDDRIYINNEIFGKGKIDKTLSIKLSEQDKYMTRLYIDGVRSLYNKSTPRSHKSLSYLFQILPYVNRRYNIVCFNPLEEDLHKIQCMSLGQFCEIIGYSSHNANQLFKTLFEPRFDINGKITTAMRYVVDKGLDKSTYSMFINPRVYYAGNMWKDVEVLGKF